MSDSKKSRAKPLLECRDTLYIDRVVDALALLCGGKAPTREMVVEWEENRSETLQTWAVNNTAVRWGTGIGTIEAAQVMANTPEEGRDHQLREDAYPVDESLIEGSTPADELAEKLTQAFGPEWSLSLSATGNGSLATSRETIHFGSARELDDLNNAEFAK
jgi:hypothetical protein